MEKYHKFQAGVSSKNKILKYMSFSAKDKVLTDFIDYLAFYTTWNHKLIYSLMSSDNGPSIYLDNFLTIQCVSKKGENFHAFVETVYNGYSISICQLKEIKIKGKVQLKIDLYGKGLKLLRENKSLFHGLYLFFTDWLLLGDTIEITRIDYTVDCMKLNFRKENKLRCHVSGRYSKKGEGTTYKLFGRKSHDSACCLRYYNKKLEIQNRGTSYLYPEYELLPEVMRYELRVNSKGLDKFEKVVPLDQLYQIISLGYEIPSEYRSHAKEGKEKSDFEMVEHLLKKMKSEKNYQDLAKVKILLDSIYIKGGLVSVVSCETSALEKHFQSN